MGGKRRRQGRRAVPTVASLEETVRERIEEGRESLNDVFNITHASILASSAGRTDCSTERHPRRARLTQKAGIRAAERPGADLQVNASGTRARPMTPRAAHRMGTKATYHQAGLNEGYFVMVTARKCHFLRVQ